LDQIRRIKRTAREAASETMRLRKVAFIRETLQEIPLLSRRKSATGMR
jgi:hypothetical protein